MLKACVRLMNLRCVALILLAGLFPYLLGAEGGCSYVNDLQDVIDEASYREGTITLTLSSFIQMIRGKAVTGIGPTAIDQPVELYFELTNVSDKSIDDILLTVTQNYVDMSTDYSTVYPIALSATTAGRYLGSLRVDELECYVNPNWGSCNNANWAIELKCLEGLGEDEAISVEIEYSYYAPSPRG